MAPPKVPTTNKKTTKDTTAAQTNIKTAASSGKNTRNLSSASSTSTGPMTRSKTKAIVSLNNQQDLMKTNSAKPMDVKIQHLKTIDPQAAKNSDIVPEKSAPPHSPHSVSDANSSVGSLSESSLEISEQSATSKNVDSQGFSYSNIVAAMMTGTTSVEDQLATMARAIENLTKTVEEKDLQIAALLSKLELQNPEESTRLPANTSNSDLQGAQSKDRRHASASGYPTDEANHASPVASLSVQQLQDMITNTIRAQYGGTPQSTLMYSKPYTRRIDNMRMPAGYQPPKIQQFDGKGNPKQHIAHFVETCNNAGTEGDLLVKQFVRSLKGNAFEWYIDLKSESIDSWEQMEREFLNRFYSTRRTVSMIELTNTRQWNDEPVMDYINRWRALSLDCKDRLTEVSAVEMCMQGMHWDLLYILQGIKPRTFEELATRSHDMEISIKTRGGKDPLILEPRKDKKDEKKVVKSSKGVVKESMIVSAVPIKVAVKDKKKEDNKPRQYQEKQNQRPTLKELEMKEYPFPDSDVLGILECLLENKVIELPECKRPQEMGRVDDPKYCKYHRIVGHSIERCFIFKEIVMNLAKQGKILLDTDEIATSNHTAVIFPSSKFERTCAYHQLFLNSGIYSTTVQFGSFESIQIYLSRGNILDKPLNEKKILQHDDEGWTLVTRRRQKQQAHVPPTGHFDRGQKKKKSQYIPKKGVQNEKSANKTALAKHTMWGEEICKPITLRDFFPKGYLEDEVVPTYMVSTVKINSEVESGKNQDEVQSIGELEKHTTTIEESSDEEVVGATSGSCCATITFTDEDLQLGSKPHNRPLFVSGYIREQKVNRILIDGGSAVNLMPKFTMKNLGITVDDLARSRLIIQGFNQGGQRTIGMIRVNLTIGGLQAETLFHVIDAKTSYNLLLGRPWVHDNGVVPSTLHQCFKFSKNGVQTVVADNRPFTEVEAHFADAKFYIEPNTSSNISTVNLPSTREVESTKAKEASSIPLDVSVTDSTKVTQKQEVVVKTHRTAPILKYVPKSQRREGQLPIVKILETEEVKLSMSHTKEKEDLQNLREELTLPLTKIEKSTPTKLPLKGFVRPSKAPVEHGFLPKQRTDEGFDPKAYKLMAKSGYDFANPTGLGKLRPELTGEKMHGLNETQKKLREQGHRIVPHKTGLGFPSTKPIRIQITKKDKKLNTLYIGIEEVGDSEDQHSVSHKSVFDRVKASSTRVSVFDRLSPSTQILNMSSSHVNNSPGTSVFKRINSPTQGRKSPHPQPRKSVFSRIKAPRGVLVTRNEEKELKKIGTNMAKDSEVRSLIPSRMKRKTEVDVTNDVTLKAKRRTIVFTAESEESNTDGRNDEVCYVTSYHITVETQSDSDPLDDEVKEAPSTLEDGGQATVDQLKEFNFGTIDEPKPVFVSSFLSASEENDYFQLLSEYKDVFAWTYKEMPGLDPKIAVHNLAVKHGTRPIKQSQRFFRPELVPKIEEEINKLIDVGFIREVKYPTWISSIVPVKKKNGQIRICVDFRDLNEACPKDDFPLPIPELTVDATTGHEALSFMDCYSGYNQIRMTPKDEELTAFRTPKGIYCYKVMPFGLKNAGATYQRAMQRIFDDILHKIVECYVDDLVVKTKEREGHLQDLRTVFDRLRKYQLKMNPLKCAFGVTSGKFLGYVVRHRGIEIDPSKVDAIQKMPPPKNLRELRSLQGQLAFIRRFISNLAGRCQPFNRLMKKDIPFEWDQACQNAFDSIKKYLLNPPVLGAPVPGKPLILYIAAQEESLGALLAQNNEEHKEKALYYLSRRLTPTELKYPPIEKTCLALVFASKKLRHYFLAHTIHLIARADPLKYVMSKPVLSGRLARWSILFNEFEIIYVPRKAVKGQVLADFLADYPIPADWEISEDFPDEEVFQIDILPPWMMFFDGAARSDGAGAGVVFVSPQRQILPYAFALTENCSNNVAEYQALIIGLQMARGMNIMDLEIYGDSKLVINQLLKDYEVKKDNLIPYHQYATHLLTKFDSVTLEHLPRKENRMADALANLATTLALVDGEIVNVPVCQQWVLPQVLEDKFEESNVISVSTVEGDDWMRPIIEYLEHGKLPEDRRHKTEIRRRAPRFIYYSGTLYRRSFEGLFLRCLGKDEAAHAMEEAHSGVCGAHQSGPKLHFRVKRMGYYWPTMVKDCMEYAKRCQACQFHANFIHQPPEPLHPTVASWPFDAWGLDVVGPLCKSSKGHLYILAATDYFSRWAEAAPFKEVKKETVVDFIKCNIIYRYGVPRYIITDNGLNFKNSWVTQLCERFDFKQHKSSMYNAPANGLAEAFNKTLCDLLKKVVSKSKKDWHERMEEALWAYRTTHRTPTQATPYSLVYGVEAVLPLERQIPSLRIAIQEGLTSEENAILRLQELEALDEKRLEAQQQLECYQARLSRAFNKKVRPRSFQVGDLVLAVRRPIIMSHRTGNKFLSKWDGPYVVREVYTNGAYKIIDEDRVLVGPINGKFLKRYYP